MSSLYIVYWIVQMKVMWQNNKYTKLEQKLFCIHLYFYQGPTQFFGYYCKGFLLSFFFVYDQYSEVLISLTNKTIETILIKADIKIGRKIATPSTIRRSI